MSMTINLLAVSEQSCQAMMQAPELISERLYESSKNECLDLDKAWHALHFILTGEVVGGEGPLAAAIFGATETECSVEDLGIIKFSDSTQVKDIHKALAVIDADDFIKRINFNALASNHIYPDIWGDNEAIEEAYLQDYFKQLVTFYLHSSDENMCVISVLR